MNLRIRNFTHEDIENKIEWINDTRNNEFLHYELPLEYEKTLKWFKNKKSNRYDGVILYNDIPVGLIGLLNINETVKEAELYILIGNHDYKNKGIAFESIRQLLEKGFIEYNLDKIYLFTETENTIAQKLFEKVGFEKIALHKDDVMNKKGELVDRFSYTILKEEFESDK